MQAYGGNAAGGSSRPPSRRRPELSATQRALGLLTRREHSRMELARKLTTRGVDPDEAHAVIDKLANAGWQDDARFAELLVRSRANAGYGPQRIRAELTSHRLADDTIAAALGACEVDWLDSAGGLVRRRHPLALQGDRVALRKAAEFLLRRGFAMDQVRGALEASEDH